MDEDAEILKKSENISSVTDFLKIIFHISKSKDKNTTYFYRGTENEEWENAPSIYRKSENKKYSLIEKEKEIFYEIISRCPDDFKHCRTALDYLVMMQHYGAPTRLLDITENPLVALYFSCKNHKNFEEKNGRIDIFKIKNDNIKKYNSDTAAIIANLTKADYNFDTTSINFLQLIEIEKTKKQKTEKIYNPDKINYLIDEKRIKDLIELITSSLEKKQPTKNKYSDIYKKDYIKNGKENELKNKILLAMHAKKILENINTYPNKNELLNSALLKLREIDILKENEEQYFTYIRFMHSIQDEKPYFDPIYLNINDIESTICVKPKHDNPHIIRQNGAFFLFGIEKGSYNKGRYAPIPNDIHYKTGTENLILKIPHKNKEKILDELESLSISEGYLFTDIAKVAFDVKKKYEYELPNSSESTA